MPNCPFKFVPKVNTSQLLVVKLSVTNTLNSSPAFKFNILALSRFFRIFMGL